MPISLDRNLIHIRVPNETEPGVSAEIVLDDSRPHGISYYLDKYPTAFNGTKKFCVVRNPWDRLAYFFDVIKNDSEMPDHDLLKNKTFAEFVEDLKTNRGEYKSNCWLPQTAWIWTQYGPIVNHILIEDPEYLQDPQFLTLSAQFKAVMDMDVPVEEIDREAALARRKNYYTEELVEVVGEMFKTDVQSFNYSYDSGVDDSDVNILESSDEELETPV